MDLQVLRTVIKNDVNEVSVCSDMKRESGTFYTLIAIYDEEIRRQVVKKVKGEGVFAKNMDFIGSFTYENSFCLVFNYRSEVRLCDKEAIIADNFKKRKELATAFVMACIESDCDQAMGELLLQDRNINIAGDSRVHFNYFMDFAQYQPGRNKDIYYNKVGDYVYGILAREYIVKFDDATEFYPKELQAFFKKKEKTGFASFNQILTFINLMPDKPTSRQTGIMRLWARFMEMLTWAKAHSMTLFIVFIVGFTLFYLTYQITARLSVSRNIEENVTFSGLYTIGEVYLGEEDL